MNITFLRPLHSPHSDLCKISRRAGAAHLPREILPSPESWGKRDREASTSAEIVLHTEDVTDIEYRLFRYSY